MCRDKSYISYSKITRASLIFVFVWKWLAKKGGLPPWIPISTLKLLSVPHMFISEILDFNYSCLAELKFGCYVIVVAFLLICIDVINNLLQELPKACLIFPHSQTHQGPSWGWFGCSVFVTAFPAEDLESIEFRSTDRRVCPFAAEPPSSSWTMGIENILDFLKVSVSWRLY